MTTSNPYEAPAAPVEAMALSPESANEAISATLRATRPWVRFVSIVAFVLIGLMLLAAAFAAVAGSFVKNLPAWLGVVYLAMAVLYVPPALYLHRYASSITAFLADRSMDRLDVALKQQKSFWKFVGVLGAVLIGIYALMIIGAGAVGLLTALGRR